MLLGWHNVGNRMHRSLVLYVQVRLASHNIFFANFGSTLFIHVIGGQWSADNARGECTPCAVGRYAADR
jgi:hypothetical protein